MSRRPPRSTRTDTLLPLRYARPISFGVLLGGFDLDRRRAGRLHQPRWAGIGFGLLGGELVQAARFLAREEGGVDRVMVADPAPAAFERIAAALDGRDGPLRLASAGPRARGGAPPPTADERRVGKECV